jgi:DNA transformation protein and related proteins
MPVRPQFLAYILEQLAALGRLRSRRMFGGVGLYSGELFFGLIDDDTVFFKSDDSNSADYRSRNMPRFMPFPARPEAVLAYYQVPADVIEDAEELVTWARKSVAVALTAHAAKQAHKPRAKGAKKAKAAKSRSAARTARPAKKKKPPARAKRGRARS